MISFDENDQKQREFYELGYQWFHRGSGPIPASLKAAPEALVSAAELGYKDAAAGQRERVPVNRPLPFGQREKDPKPESPVSTPSVPPAPPGKTGTKPARPADEKDEYYPPNQQATYWYLAGYRQETAVPPSSQLKWYRAGLKDGRAAAPPRAAEPKTGTQPAPQNDGSGLAIGVGLAALLIVGVWYAAKGSKNGR